MREIETMAVVDLCLDLERELGEARTLDPEPCRHAWGFVPPERSAGAIRECRGYGVLVCHECGEIRPAREADLADFRAAKLGDIRLYWDNGGQRYRQGENL